MTLERSQQQQLQRMAARGDPRAKATLEQLAQPVRAVARCDASAGFEAPRVTRAVIAQPNLNGMVLIKLPIPPSVNNIYRPGERGQRRLTDAAKQWKRVAATLVRAAHSHPTPFAGAVRLEIALIPVDARQFDIDNRLKLLLDALQDGALIADDAQILELSVSKKPPCKTESCAKLSITKIGEK